VEVNSRWATGSLKVKYHTVVAVVVVKPGEFGKAETIAVETRMTSSQTPGLARDSYLHGVPFDVTIL